MFTQKATFNIHKSMHIHRLQANTSTLREVPVLNWRDIFVTKFLSFIKNILIIYNHQHSEILLYGSHRPV